MGTSYSWGDSDWTQEENFSQWEQSVIGIISPGKWWIPQHWTLLRFSWAGCWAIMSRLFFRLCFCQERLDSPDPWGLSQPGILSFCEAILLWHLCLFFFFFKKKPNKKKTTKKRLVGRLMCFLNCVWVCSWFSKCKHRAENQYFLQWVASSSFTAVAFWCCQWVLALLRQKYI